MLVSFVVTKEGKVTNVKVLRGVDPELDREAVRVISNSPLWEKGYANVEYKHPVTFQLR